MQNIYRDKKILILGLGINEGGLGAAKFFAEAGAKVKVTDLKSGKELKPSLDNLKEFQNIQYVLGEHKFEDIDWADIIIRNQAITPSNLYLKYAKKRDKKIETDIGIFLDQIDCKQIIGITGSKGKTTTASLIYEILKRVQDDSRGIDGFKEVVLAGNIGKSVLDTLDKIDHKTLIILELSSFQLEAFEEHKVSPKIAIITNIFPEHLNYYSSMDDYTGAKRIIAKYQSSRDYLFLNQVDKISISKDFLSGVKARIIYFSTEDLPEDFRPTLKGEHNKLSYAAALAVVKNLGISEKDALKAMNEFKGAEFRLQLVKKWNGIKIYNDSTATNPDSTIQALKTLPSSILICGGMDKGLEYQLLADQIDKSAKAIFFLDGDATEKIIAGMKHKRIMRSIYSDLLQLLEDVKTEAKMGDTILFSPGATSFNLFQNEFDRGRKFNTVVEKVFA